MAAKLGTEHKVIEVSSKSDFDKHVSAAGNKHVLVEFFAAWCGPCRIIGPRLEEMAREYADKLVIIKLDVDDNEELAEEYGVSSMPTFMIMKNKLMLEKFVGSNYERVEQVVQKFCGKSVTGIATPQQIKASAGQSEKK